MPLSKNSHALDLYTVLACCFALTANVEAAPLFDLHDEPLQDVNLTSPVRLLRVLAVTPSAVRLESRRRRFLYPASQKISCMPPSSEMTTDTIRVTERIRRALMCGCNGRVHSVVLPMHG